MTKLGDHIQLNYGAALPQQKREPGNYPVYGSSGVVGYHSQPLVSGPSIIVGRKGTIGSVTLSETDFWPIDTTYYVQSDRTVDTKWLYYQLQSLNLEKMNSAGAIPGLNRNEVLNLKVEIPTKSVQQKISTILSSIDDAIQKTDQIIQKIEELKRGLLNQLTTNINGKSIKLGDVIKIKNGFAYSGRNMVNEKTNTILLTPGNVEIGGGFNFAKLRYYSGKVIRGYELKRGDIFIALTDLTPQANFLGFPAIVPYWNKTFLHNQRLGFIQVTSVNADQMFIYFLLMTFEYRKHVLSTATGTTVKHTSVSKILNFKFNLPTLDSQKKAVKTLEIIEHDLKMERETKNSYLKLKKSLMHDIFNQKVQIN